MKLTKKEIQMFKEITLNTPKTSSELAEATKTSQSYTSTTLNNMTKKGLIQKTRNGKNKTPHPENTPHATILRNMILNNPQTNLDYLANNGIQILASITCQNIRTIEELSKASGTSYKSLWMFMDKAKSQGIIINQDTIAINSRHEQVSQFVKSYNLYIHEAQARAYANDAVIKWSCGDQYLFETKKQLSLQSTGISAFQKYGALFLTLTTIYTNSKKTLKLEDHLINHILSEGTENILPLLITWRLNENSIDKDYIEKKSYRYKIKEITEAVQIYLDTKGAQKSDYLINWEEFNNKYKEYQT